MKKKNSDKEKNLIHVRIEYKEGIESKRNLLNSEMNLLKAAKAIKNYHILRIIELKLKMQIIQNMKTINANIKKLEKIMPRIENSMKFKTIETKRIDKETYDGDIERELRNIQEKLNSLQA